MSTAEATALREAARPAQGIDALLAVPAGRPRAEQPDGAVADDPQPRARRQCPEPARRHLLRPARVGRPDHHRGHAGQPAGRRLHPHAGHPFAGAGRRLAQGHRRGAPAGGRFSRSSGTSDASRIRISTAARCRSRLRRCRSRAKPSPKRQGQDRDAARTRDSPSCRGIVAQFRTARRERQGRRLRRRRTARRQRLPAGSVPARRHQPRAPTPMAAASRTASRFPLEVTDAVIAVWGPERVGYKLSPYFAGYSMSDSDPVGPSAISRRSWRARDRLSARRRGDRRTDGGRRHRARDADPAQNLRRHA